MAVDNKAEFEIAAKNTTKQVFTKVSAELRQLTGMAANYGAVAGGIAVGGIALLVKNSMRSVDALAKVADTVNITTQELSGLQQAAELTGVGSEAMDKSIQKMVRGIGDAQQGLSTQVKAFEKINIKVDDLAKQDAGEQFRRIAEGVRQLGTRSEQAAVASAIFGKQGVNLINTFDLGAEKLKAITMETEAFGLGINRVDASKIEAANDSITRATSVFKGVGNTIAVKLSPIISGLANRFADVARESNGFRDQISSGMEMSAKAVGFVADAVNGLKIVFLGVKQVIAEVFNAFIQYSKFANNTLADLVNSFSSITGKTVEFKFINDFAESSKVTTEQFRSELEAAVSKPLPSTAIQQFIRDVQAEGQAAAEAVAETRAKVVNTDAVHSHVIINLDKMKAELAALEQGFMTREAREIESNARRVELVNQSFENGLIDEQRRNAILQSLAKDHEEKLNEITLQGLSARERFDRLSTKMKVQSVLSSGVEMTQGVATTSKSMFEVNKKLAMAQAAVALPAAVIQSFENAGGYPWGLVPAGLMLITGLKQIAAIRKQTYGGAGGAPSLAGLGGGSSTVNTVPIRQPMVPQLSGNQQSQGGVVVQVIVNGAITREMIRDEVVPEIIDGVNNRDIQLISPDSRNGIDLRTGTDG